MERLHVILRYSKTCEKRSLSKRPKIGFQDEFSLNAGQKYCRMLQEHSAILSAFIKLPIVIKIFVLSFLRVAVLHMLYGTYFLVIVGGDVYISYNYTRVSPGIIRTEERRR